MNQLFGGLSVTILVLFLSLTGYSLMSAAIREKMEHWAVRYFVYGLFSILSFFVAIVMTGAINQ